LHIADVSGNPRLGEIINNKTQAIIKMRGQEWLERYYPNKQLTSEIKLEEWEQIEGELAINDYPNLEKIDVRIKAGD